MNEQQPVKLGPLSDPSEAQKPAPPSPLNPSARVGYALVGLGHLTLEELLPAFAECKLSKPVALVSGDREKALRVAAQYGIAESSIYSYDDFDRIGENDEIKAVYIVLPNSMHEEFTVRAAAAGKHVLCEKPMAHSVAAAERMIRACTDAGCKLMVAYRIQYEPMNRQLREWTMSREWGKVRLIELFNGQNISGKPNWRLTQSLGGGGALPDIGIYCLNTARYLTGEEPEWVSATIYNTPGDERFTEVEESMLFQMRFPGGTMVSASTSYGVHEARSYRCYADRGAWFGMDPAFSYEGLKVQLHHVKDGKAYLLQPVIAEVNQFAAEIDHFSDCILNDRRPFTPGEEGLQDQRIMEALYRSAKEGRPVELESVAGKDAFRGDPPKVD